MSGLRRRMVGRRRRMSGLRRRMVGRRRRMGGLSSPNPCRHAAISTWHRGQYYGRIQGPAFVYPRGWAYRRWTIGTRLPPVLFAPAYFYPGWAALGLGAAPPGYAWVRYGPDLLEVNLISGEVEDVVYGVFY